MGLAWFGSGSSSTLRLNQNNIDTMELNKELDDDLHVFSHSANSSRNPLVKFFALFGFFLFGAPSPSPAVEFSQV